ILASGFTKEVNRRKLLFRNKVIRYLKDGILNQGERRQLKQLAHELSIPPQEVRTVIWEIRNMQLKLTELNCPHCSEVIEIEHYSDHIKIKNKSTKK
ncbi:MAG: hypothetical protein AB8B80_09715, partial [Marinicellaceae bacterium]